MSTWSKTTNKLVVLLVMTAADQEQVLVRQMRTSDWPRVAAIYQAGIDSGIATFETKVPDWSEFDAKFIENPRLVADFRQAVSGFAILSQFSPRKVYSGVAEVTVYVHENMRSKGVATVLLRELIRQSEAKGIWSLQASIFKQNTASLKLHEKCGFRKIGFREKIARREGVWLDNFIYERRSKNIGI